MKKELLHYEIRVQGYLDLRRLHWLENLTVTQSTNNETVLMGPIPDQAALFGLLSWLYDLGIPLLSVKRLVNQNEETEK